MVDFIGTDGERKMGKSSAPLSTAEYLSRKYDLYFSHPKRFINIRSRRCQILLNQMINQTTELDPNESETSSLRSNDGFRQGN
jgi:hypothetical protein